MEMMIRFLFYVFDILCGCIIVCKFVSHCRCQPWEAFGTNFGIYILLIDMHCICKFALWTWCRQNSWVLNQVNLSVTWDKNDHALVCFLHNSDLCAGAQCRLNVICVHSESLIITVLVLLSHFQWIVLVFNKLWQIHYNMQEWYKTTNLWGSGR